MSHSCSEGKEMFNNFARTVYVQSCCFGNLSLLLNYLVATLVAVVVRLKLSNIRELR